MEEDRQTHARTRAPRVAARARWLRVRLTGRGTAAARPRGRAGAPVGIDLCSSDEDEAGFNMKSNAGGGAG